MEDKQFSSIFFSSNTTKDNGGDVTKSPFFAPHPPKHQLVTTPNGSISTVKDIDVEQKSSVLGASFNLCNNVIGAGIVSIPFAISQCSLVLGVLMVIFFGLCTVKTLRLLIETAKHVDVSTYERLAEASFGSTGYNLVSISMFVFAYGAMVGYLMIIKVNLSYLIGVEEDDTMMKNAVLTVSSLLIILPISLQRDMGNLAKTSTISVMFDCIMVGIVAYFSPERQSVEEHGGLMQVMETSKLNIDTFFIGIGVLCFAFVCQHSSFIIASSLDKPTKERWNVVTGISITTCATLALTIGIGGYLGFLKETQGDILTNLGQYALGVDKTTQLAANVAKGLLCSTMFFVYPTELFVARHACVVMLFRGRRAHEGDDHSVLMRRDRRVSVTTALYLSSLLPALLVDDLGHVFSLTGSLGGATLSYLGPGLFYLAVHGSAFLQKANRQWGPEYVRCFLKNKENDLNAIKPRTLHCLCFGCFKFLSWYILLMPIWYRIALHGKKMLKKHERIEALKSPLPYAFGKIIHHRKQNGDAKKKRRLFATNTDESKPMSRVGSLPAILKPNKNPASIRATGSFGTPRSKKVGFAGKDSLGNDLSVNEKERLLSEHRPISADSFYAASFEVIRPGSSSVIHEECDEEASELSASPPADEDQSLRNFGSKGYDSINNSIESYELDSLNRPTEIPEDGSSIFVEDNEIDDEMYESDCFSEGSSVGVVPSPIRNPVITVSTYSKYDNVKASPDILKQMQYDNVDSIIQTSPEKEDKGEEDPQANSPTVIDFVIACSFVIFGFVAAFAGVFSTIHSKLDESTDLI